MTSSRVTINPVDVRDAQSRADADVPAETVPDGRVVLAGVADGYVTPAVEAAARADVPGGAA